ncbi:VOC family protein [Meiothermus sp. CFH 77666]|uniref:VOC family protein n=1 Tax=Meiothermus sp. CFH 77666 TaxID=2817942 RepID=UPI001AA0AE9A|nr:VOC family protein [Meiothermus sp. CFH 77666]MBO1437740.1 VOC family protein [Meiothermus sp. CFH 77666]
MPRLQHIALQSSRLEATRDFYRETLGLPEVRYDGEVGTVWVNFPDGFVLRFDRSSVPPDPGALTYLGLELDDFAQVDAMYQKLSDFLPIERDLRETYRHRQGPYGFILRDPNGYAIKVFKYKLP